MMEVIFDRYKLDKHYLIRIDRKYFTKNIITYIFIHYTNVYNYSPTEFINRELLITYVNANGNNLLDIPKVHIDEELANLALNNTIIHLSAIPIHVRMQNMVLDYVKHDLSVLDGSPHIARLLDYNRCLYAVKQKGISLKYTPVHLLNAELCTIAVKQNGLALQYAPNELFTNCICLDAIMQNAHAIRYIFSRIAVNTKDINLSYA